MSANDYYHQGPPPPQGYGGYPQQVNNLAMLAYCPRRVGLSVSNADNLAHRVTAALLLQDQEDTTPRKAANPQCSTPRHNNNSNRTAAAAVV